MTVITFDTLAVYERLRRVKLDDAVAKEFAEILKEREEIQMQNMTEALATKRDLEQGLKGLEIRLIKWFVGTMVAVGAIAIAFAALFIG